MAIFHLSSCLYWLYNPKHFAQFCQTSRSKSSIQARFERIVWSE